MHTRIMCIEYKYDTYYKYVSIIQTMSAYVIIIGANRNGLCDSALIRTALRTIYVYISVYYHKYTLSLCYFFNLFFLSLRSNV